MQLAALSQMYAFYTVWSDRTRKEISAPAKLSLPVLKFVIKANQPTI